MTIKPEQVPEASMRALCKSMNCEWVMQSPEDLAVCRRHIAAALNAWPGKSFEEKHNLLTQTSHTNLVIPLGEA